MAVQSMKFVSMVGPVEAYEAFVLKYVLYSGIHLERAFLTLRMKSIEPFFVENQYEPVLKRMKGLNDFIGSELLRYDQEQMERLVLSPFDKEAVPGWLDEIEDRIRKYRLDKEQLEQEILEREQTIRQIKPLTALAVDVDAMFHVSYLKFRFGRMPKETFHKQKANFEAMEVIVIPTVEEEGEVWLSYFTPASFGAKIDSVFSALGFNRVRIPEAVHGKSTDIISRLEMEIREMQHRLAAEELESETWLQAIRPKFQELMNRMAYLSKASEIKTLCARTRDSFHLVGWMPTPAWKKLHDMVDPMEGVMVESEDPENVAHAAPPTILKNSWFFKPFENIVSMYGLPSHNELDPTKFVTITFVLMFGFMFGDVGQGILIALLGAFLYFKKQSALGGVMLYAGSSSTIFGFLYGSVFGNEEWIQPLWLSPIHSAENINTLMYVSVGYGAFILLLTIGFSLFNAFRNRDWGRFLFDRNGLAGLLFYGGILFLVLRSLQTGNLRLTGVVLSVVVVLPLILMLLKEPLVHLMEKKRPIFPAEKGMFFTESGFELFETLLGFLSSTISFVRLGAFAMNHAGFSLAVWTLYGMMEGSAGGIITLVLGNLLIMVLEGLIVGIQCLRLEFYESFGRFYRGDGQPFRPLLMQEETIPGAPVSRKA